jgi:aspartate/methionine/tyrosine aminotransferase
MLGSTPVFSRRSRATFEPNRLSQALAQARASGAALVDLTSGNPTSAGIPYDSRVARALSPDGPVRYEPEPFGLPSARRALTELWAERGVAVRPESVIVTASTSEAYAFAVKLLCDPGDEVLVPAPSYPLIEELAKLDSISLVRYPPRLRERLFARPRVAPPRGDAAYARHRRGEPEQSDRLVPEARRARRARRARFAARLRRGVRRVPVDRATRRACVRRSKNRVCSCARSTGFRSSAALPHVKLARMTLGGPPGAVDEALLRPRARRRRVSLSSTIAQAALPELLRSRHVAAGAIRARLAKNHERLVEKCAASAVTPLVVEGGWYAVLRLPNLASDEEWALAFVEAGVSVHPGYFYDFVGPPHAVVSLLVPEDDFATGVERLLECVDARVARRSSEHPGGDALER